VPFHEPTAEEIDPDVTRIFPFHLAKKHVLLPLHKNEAGHTVVAMSDPTNGTSLEDLRAYYPDGVKVLLSSPEEILKLLERHHKQNTNVESTRIVLEFTNNEEMETEVEAKKIHEIAFGPKVIAAVNNIIAGAKKENSSDIHIEPYRDNLRIRYRIDGVLRERGILNKSMHMPIVSRVKIMGQLDIAERRIPQDGRARVKLMGQALDLRISTCPTQFGEKVVMRLFAKDNIKTIESLGFSDRDRKLFIDIISKPHGMFLVTGPTGSGKSSTLYAGLLRINSPEVNIITIEDPIENELDGINQVAINHKANLTFASVLRSVLRQDPDICMIGEIRDRETADIGVRAAITGHMVLSTLHTNSAAGAIDRLKDLGLEPFMLATSLKGVLAQRLVRRICTSCRAEVATENLYNIKLSRNFVGSGCKDCNFSGFAGGRLGIFELVDITADIRKLINQGAGEDQIQKYLREQNLPSMIDDGVSKVEQGITTLDEVMSAATED
jgi:type IV pilus assembly protein PilB